MLEVGGGWDRGLTPFWLATSCLLQFSQRSQPSPSFFSKMAPNSKIYIIRHAQGLHVSYITVRLLDLEVDLLNSSRLHFVPPPGFSLSLPRRSVRNVLLLSKNVDGDTSIRDPRLTNLGRQQSSEAGRKLASIQHRIQLVLTSPMARTLETSQLAFGSAIERLGKEKVICLPQFQG